MRNNNRVTVGLRDYNLRLQRNESGGGGERWEQSVLYSLPGCDGDAHSAGCFVLVWGELCSTTWFDLVMRHWWVWGEIGQRSTNALQNCNVKYAVSSLSAADKKREWSERARRAIWLSSAHARCRPPLLTDVNTLAKRCWLAPMLKLNS